MGPTLDVLLTLGVRAEIFLKAYQIKRIIRFRNFRFLAFPSFSRFS